MKNVYALNLKIHQHQQYFHCGFNFKQSILNILLHEYFYMYIKSNMLQYMFICI